MEMVAVPPPGDNNQLADALSKPGFSTKFIGAAELDWLLAVLEMLLSVLDAVEATLLALDALELVLLTEF